MSKSIRYYYFTSIATVLVSSVLVMGLLQIVLSLTYFRQQSQSGLQRVVEGVAEGFAAGAVAMESPDSVTTVEYLAGVGEANILIADTAGSVVYATDGAEEQLGGILPESAVEEIRKKAIYSEDGNLSGFFPRRHYILAAPLVNAAGAEVGFVVASSDASNARFYLSDTLSSFILAGGLVLMVSSLLALVLANRTVIPIRRVSDAAKRFGEGDYSARVPVEGDDELAQLALTFNEMASSCEATDTSRRAFMGNIAHELRTPMTTIKGFIDGMLDGTIPAEQRGKYLGIVSEEVGRLARLTQNMLDISKLEAGEYTPKSDNFDIWGPLASVFINAERRLEEKNIEIRGAEDTEPTWVQADEDFVHQVLFNILDNAIKFTEPGGTISVQVMPGKASATISVMNTGAGIPAETLPYVFDRFYKADESRGLNARGSGLGLHICKVLVGLMGGRIWAESEEGQWTSFLFTLPNGRPPRAAARFAEGRVKDDPEGQAGEEA